MPMNGVIRDKFTHKKKTESNSFRVWCELIIISCVSWIWDDGGEGASTINKYGP